MRKSQKPRNGDYSGLLPGKNMEFVPCPVCTRDDCAIYAHVDGSFRFCRCRRCGTIYQNPRLTSSAAAAQYDSEYFATSNVCSGYLNYTHTLQQQRKTAAWLWDQIERATKGTVRSVLDVGCGSGEFLMEGQRRKVNCWGNDLYASATRKPYHFVPGDFNRVEFPLASFDMVIFNDSFEHFLEPATPLGRCKTILRAGGYVAINTPDPDSWLARISGQSWISLKHEHLVIYPRRVLLKLLLTHNFVDCRRLSSRQYADWDYLRPRLERLSPPLARIIGLVAPFVGAKAYLIPTGGMIILGRFNPA